LYKYFLSSGIRFLTVLSLLGLASCISKPEFSAPTPGIAESLAVAQTQNTIEAYEAFLSRFSARNWHDNPFKEKARYAISDLKAAQQAAEDDAAWNHAVRMDTVAAYTAYLDADHYRHIEAAKRGIARRALRDAADTGRAYLIVTEHYEQAPADFSMPLIRQTAEALLQDARVEIVDADIVARDKSVLVHSIEVKGTGWQQQWHLPAVKGVPSSKTTKLYTGYQIEIDITTSVGPHRVEQHLKIDASAGEPTPLYATPTLSAREIDMFREPGAIFNYYNGIFHSNNRYELDRRIRRAFMGQLLGVHGCGIAFTLDASTRALSPSQRRTNRFWDDLNKAIKDKSLDQSASDCEIMLERICSINEYDRATASHGAICSTIKARWHPEPITSGVYAQVFREKVYESGPGTFIVSESRFKVGKSTPLSQRCYSETVETRDRPQVRSLLAEMRKGNVVYVNTKRKPAFVDKYCRFTDGDRLRP
jgi:hypothetical protein